MQVTIQFPFGDRIVEHVKRNKNKYIVGAGFIVVAGVAYYFRIQNTDVTAKAINKAGVIFGDQTNNIKIINRTNHGRPGNMVRNTDLDKYYAAQREAARIYGIPEPVMSKHVNGLIPDAYGHHFEKVY